MKNCMNIDVVTDEINSNIEEGCTPADAMTLRKANHSLKDENDQLRDRLLEAIDRINDMLKGDDGQAWDEAEKFLDKLYKEV